jgi:hypothetical protein
MVLNSVHYGEHHGMAWGNHAPTVIDSVNNNMTRHARSFFGESISMCFQSELICVTGDNTIRARACAPPNTWATPSGDLPLAAGELNQFEEDVNNPDGPGYNGFLYTINNNKEDAPFELEPKPKTQDDHMSNDHTKQEHEDDAGLQENPLKTITNVALPSGILYLFNRRFGPWATQRKFAPH